MFKLNKKTEYALLALRFLGGLGPEDVTSARDVAGHYGIPEMILAKVLQTLKRGGFATSVKGAGGGYSLARDLERITVKELLDLFNEPMALVECIDDAAEDDCCQQQVQCDIKGPMSALNAAIHQLLSGMTVADLFQQPEAMPRTLSIYRFGQPQMVGK